MKCLIVKRIEELPIRVTGAVEGQILIDMKVTTAKYTHVRAFDDESFRPLIQNSSELIIVVNSEGLVRYASPSAEKLTGRLPADISGKKLLDFVHRDDQRATAEAINAVLQSPQLKIDYVLKFKHIDGSWVNLETVWCNHIGSNRVNGIVINCRDVSYLKSLEDEAGKYRQLRNITENVKDITYSVDSGGTITYISSQISRYGLEPENVIGMRIIDFVISEDRAKVVNDFEKSISTGTYEEPTQFRHKSPDGSIKWFEEHGKIQKDANGKVIGIVGVIRDVTSRKEVEDEMTSAMDFLHNVLNALDDPFFVKNEDHQWILLNDKICELMGYSREELIGKSDYDLFPKEQAEIFWAKDDEVLRTGKTDLNIEQIAWRGSTRTIATKKSLFIDPVNGRKFIVGVIRDISAADQSMNHFSEPKS